MKIMNDEIFLLKSLSRRRPLLQDEQDFYQKLLSGYQGEKAFKNLFEEACPHLNLLVDFQVQVYGQDLQIDALACVDKRLYHFEIKNYDFDFTYRQGQAFFGRSQKAIENPFRQLKRSQALLRQVLQNYSKAVELISLVVFINENCRVDVDETCDSLCLSRREVVEFLDKFAHSTADLALENWLRVQHNPLNNLDYTYEKLDMTLPLKSGLLCHECGCEMKESNRYKIACSGCGEVLAKNEVIHNLVREYALLFPCASLYSTKIESFFKKAVTKKIIYEELKESYTKISNKRRSGLLNPNKLAYELAELNRQKRSIVNR